VKGVLRSTVTYKIQSGVRGRVDEPLNIDLGWIESMESIASNSACLVALYFWFVAFRPGIKKLYFFTCLEDGVVLYEYTADWDFAHV
jgi:hypothetical protein